jgi:hypothetical protein
MPVQCRKKLWCMLKQPVLPRLWGKLHRLEPHFGLTIAAHGGTQLLRYQLRPEAQA